MGREIRRVALDFNWPIGTIWKGYVCPYRPTECKQCDGSGLNSATKKLQDDWYSLSSPVRYAGWCYRLEQVDVDALVEANRLFDFTHTWTKGEGWKLKDPPYHPTAAEVNEWARRGFGHDSINCWVCVKARAERLGFYGTCELCNGDGHYWCDPKFEKLYQDWKGIDPPEGEGWQLWETVSEGSPCSIVAASAEELAVWLSKNGDGSKVNAGMSADDWLAFIRKG